MSIDEQALRDGLASERRELLAEIDADESRLARGDDEQVAAALELRRSQLRKVEHALERHEAGTWRECEACGDRIGDDQIRALATATHCVECAEDQVYWGDTQVLDLDELGVSGD